MNRSIFEIYFLHITQLHKICLILINKLLILANDEQLEFLGIVNIISNIDFFDLAFGTLLKSLIITGQKHKI